MFLQKAIARSVSRARLDKVVLYAVRYSSTTTGTTHDAAPPPPQANPFRKLNKAMKAYVERSIAYNEFMKKEELAFNIGKRHLANMMGVEPETFTQKDIDEAIEYLFPSGIYDKKARPFMKPPQDVFPPRKDAQFDETGRPFHFLFYTGKSNFYSILHETVVRLNELDATEDALMKARKPIPANNIDVSGSKWLSKSELEALTVEELTDQEYTNFVNAMERLLAHRMSFTQKDFIMKQRKILIDLSKSFAVPEPQTGLDGRLYITTQECPRKSARATVTVVKPGTGKIEINGKGLDIFPTIQARNQIVCGDLRSLSQPSISRIINAVSRSIALHLRRFVTFPRDLTDLKTQFYEIANFPNVVGCIDCTHVPIKSPGGQNGEVFRNRKGWMSLNVQVVAGPRLEILDIVVRWPGCAHDSRIFENSGVMVKFEQQRINGILLGDGGYRQRRYLFTPILNPSSPSEQRYNRAHIKTRNSVERCFGVWKRRFSCLSKKLNNKLSTTRTIITATAVLHNIALSRNERFHHEEGMNEDPVPTQAVNDEPRGRAIRAAFIERHFT